jgi:hypothetical protein
VARAGDGLGSAMRAEHGVQIAHARQQRIAGITLASSIRGHRFRQGRVSGQDVADGRLLMLEQATKRSPTPLIRMIAVEPSGGRDWSPSSIIRRFPKAILDSVEA